MKHFKLYCIKDLTFLSHCKFTYGHIYNASYDNDNYFTIIDNNNETFLFHKNSPFNLNMKSIYFSDLTEIRKEKLLKINQTR